jgi:hypothetical protein
MRGRAISSPMEILSVISASIIGPQGRRRREPPGAAPESC